MRVFSAVFSMKVLLRKIALSILLLLSFAMARGTRAAAAAEKPGRQSAWEKTIAGAKKEGAVSLWGDMEITHPDVVAAFTKEFPFIRPITITGRVGDLTMRILSERRAGKYLADLYSGVMGGAAFYEFYRTGVTDRSNPLLSSPKSRMNPSGLAASIIMSTPTASTLFFMRGMSQEQASSTTRSW